MGGYSTSGAELKKIHILHSDKISNDRKVSILRGIYS